MTLSYLKSKIQEVIHTLAGKASVTYSQEGEDLIFKQIFENSSSGFYVDVGAHHPLRFSNTYFLYESGWRGINIDANPDSMKIFNKLRKRDINLEVAVSSYKGHCYLFQFPEPALNFISSSNSAIVNQPCIKTKVACLPLSQIFETHMPKNQIIDLLLIDVEGHDLTVLESNNWEKFQPLIIMVEISGRGIADIIQHPSHQFLLEKGYELEYKTFRNAIYFLKY